ncbi:hypothetical protein JB92DRAFT_3105242 [Gautieria morchelliformis]|nr:hypothetical protein JB92DRAFT_3105242 [Gautieria morchelliformis]
MPRFNFTFQEASPLISYTDFWAVGSPSKDPLWNEYDGSFRVTNSSDGNATIHFNGTGVSIFGARRTNHGNYMVVLDGNSSTLNGNGPNIFQTPLFEQYGLPNEPHTVEISNHPSGSGPYLDIDFIQIERAVGQENDTVYSTTLASSSPYVNYTQGEWHPQALTLNGSNTTYQSVSPQSQFAITFQGCCIELYGLYANAGYNVSMDGGTPAPMHGMNITLNPSMWYQNTLLHMVDGLPEDVNHTVTVNTLASTERPFSFDHAVVKSTQSTPFSSGMASSPVMTSSPAMASSPVRASSPVALIVGFSVGVVVLLLLSGIALLVLRRRKRRIPLGVDLMEEVDPPKFTSAPVPWVLLRAAHRPPSTWQLSSIVSGWRRLPGETESGISPTTESRSLPSLPSDTTSTSASSRRPRATRQPQPRPPLRQFNVVNR